MFRYFPFDCRGTFSLTTRIKENRGVRFIEFAAAYEAALLDDDWRRVAPFFAERARYTTELPLELIESVLFEDGLIVNLEDHYAADAQAHIAAYLREQGPALGLGIG